MRRDNSGPTAPDAQTAAATAEFVANRLATETFLRGVDLLNAIVGGDISHGLLLNGLLCRQLSETVGPRESLVLSAEWNESMSIHQLARSLHLPYPTVHRHLAILAGKGLATRTADGRVDVGKDLLRGKRGDDFKRRSIASISRFLVALHRLGILTGNIAALERDGGLSRAQQDVLFRASMEIILANLLLTARFYDDLTTGLVYKLVATANVKHLTAVPPGVVDYFPDALRRPISIYGAAKALHMPYETTRRIAKRLLERKIFVQLANKGLIVPAEAHRQMDNPLTKRESFRTIAAGIAQIQHAGLQFSLLSP